MKILLVENDSAAVLTLTEVARQQEYELTVCTHLGTALQALNQEMYPIVFVASDLPDGTGLVLCQQIRAGAMGHQIHVVMVGNSRDVKRLPDALKAGIDDYLVKPLSANAIKVSLAFAERDLAQLKADAPDGILEQETISDSQSEALAEINAFLRNEIATRKKVEELLQKRTHELGDHVRELDCLHTISRLMERRQVPFQETLQGIVETVPRAWHYAEIACARLTLSDEVYATANWKETDWKMFAPLISHGEEIGMLTVCYLKKLPEFENEAFREAERKLLDTIAERLRELVERKQADDALRRLEKAIETMQLGVTIADVDQKILYVNPAEARNHGYDREELIGQDVGIFAPPQLRQPLTPAKLSKLRPWVREGINIRKDGTVFPVQLISDVVKNSEGEPIAIVTSCLDITERKEAESELLQLKKAIETLQLGVTFTDTNGIIRYTNPADAAMHGYNRDELIGQDVGIYAPSEIRNPMTKAQMRRIKTWNRKSNNRRKDGTIFPVRLISDVVRDSQGEPIGIVTTCEDLSTSEEE